MAQINHRPSDGRPTPLDVLLYRFGTVFVSFGIYSVASYFVMAIIK